MNKLIGIIWLGLLVAVARADGPPAFAPSTSYESMPIEGWTARVHRGFLNDQPRLAGETLTLLADQLRAIVRIVPPEAVAKLRTVPIWVEEREPNHPCMCYHPAEGWLRDHGMNPDKARAVEIANARNFLDWCRDQPWMVFHELAHAYHHQFIKNGFENDEVSKALETARSKGQYDRVLRVNGREERHYALTNPMELFAEGSEALFGTNDFYPFVRAELKRHDPELYALLRRLWLVVPSAEKAAGEPPPSR
jgi:hypothetical protein